ncbi:hypothetical protein [Anaerotignum sp.]
MITCALMLMCFGLLIIALVLDMILLMPIFLVVYIYKAIKAKLDERKLIKKMLEDLKKEGETWEKTNM